MIRTMINGFCMALADSVPGVSGGTVPFFRGFFTSLPVRAMTFPLARWEPSLIHIGRCPRNGRVKALGWPRC